MRIYSVYLAGPYQRKAEINERAQELRNEGIIVTSSWLNEPHEPTTHTLELSQNDRAKYALQDLMDIAQSQTLIQFLDPASWRGGMHVEFGYAVASSKNVIVVGPESATNIFHALPHVKRFETWLEAKEYLRASNQLRGEQ